MSHIFFYSITIICTVSFFLASQLRHALTYYRIQFLKTYRKIDAAKRDASAENSIPPEISCCTKPDIDLTERKIATGDSDRVNWVATSFNKVGTTIFALGDNRIPQCNVRIANRGSSRSAGRIPQQNPFPPFPVAIETLCCWDCKARIVSYYAHHWARSRSVNIQCRCLIKIERKILTSKSISTLLFPNCFLNCF